MNTKKDIVSILTPCFNHEKFIKKFIESVMMQSCSQWELIIVDDCSSDNSVNIINKFIDPRIKLIEHKYNKGINAALNTAFDNSSGIYLSFLASDDLMPSTYIESIIEGYKKHTEAKALYFNLLCIDYDGKHTGLSCTHEKKDRYEILRHLFYKGNCMQSPGMSIKIEAASNLFPLNLSMSQYQDYKLHVDVLLNNNIAFIDSPSIYYRIPSEKSGISFGSERTENQHKLETKILMDSFLNITDSVQLKKIFNINVDPCFDNDIFFKKYVIANLALKSKCLYKRLWAYDEISTVLSTSKGFDIINRHTSFCYKDLLDLSSKVFLPNGDFVYKNKYLKYKKLFNLSLLLNLLVLFFAFLFFRALY